MDTVLAAILLGALGSVGIVFFLSRRRVSGASATMSSDPFIPVEAHGGVESSSGRAEYFDMEELQMATGNFSLKNFLGCGNFGRVYRGVLQNGTIVAIKMRSGVETDDFADEARFLSSIRHQNLVTLLGHCQENNLQCLVYEYISNGNVFSHLLTDAGQTSPRMRDFKSRLIVALGAAKGLAYLHSISPHLLHMDFKTANVLLGEIYEIKVDDATLSIFFEDPSSPVDARDKIFQAPEVTQELIFSEKSDVYSFGVFLLELVSGGRATESPFPDSWLNLVGWVRSNEASDEIMNIADEKLGSSFTVEAMKGCIELAVQCVHLSSGMRPDMSSVVKELEGILEHA